MDLTPHAPVGATVRELDLRHASPETVEELRGLMAEHGVLVLPDQHLDDGEFVALLESFGELTFTEGETPVPEHPDLNVISNVGRTAPPRSSFHVDTSYVADPPAYTALRAVEIPTQGGGTLFTNQFRAYDTLAPELREHLDGRTITHVVTGVELADDAESSAEHPVFRPHPRTGRPALYLTTPPRCRSMSGLEDDEAYRVIAALFAHSTHEDNTFRHAWSAGDVVIWDNACVLHRADHSAVVGDRVLHRGMVARHTAGPVGIERTTREN